MMSTSVVTGVAQRPSPIKGFVLNWIFILSAGFCTAVPFLLHSSTECQMHWFCWPSIKLSVVLYLLQHQEIYGVPKERGWELFALAQVAICSFLVLLDIHEEEFRSKQKDIKWIIVGLTLVVVLSIPAVWKLVNGDILWYQILTLLIITFLPLIDGMIWWETGNSKCLRLLLFVDIPVWLGIVTLDVYVWFFHSHELPHSFYSGAIAFQFIMGNVLLYTINFYSEVRENHDDLKLTTRQRFLGASH